MITARIEDYLEELFLLECTGREITVTNVAEHLKITKGTVTATIQKLVELGLARHERYGSLHLTQEGRRTGMITYRRHEGFRAFFHEMLGLDRNVSSEMACSMEHYVDDKTENRLYALLEYFRKARAENQSWVDELFAATESPAIVWPVPLTLCECGINTPIVRITAEGELRKEIIDKGFIPGNRVELERINNDIYFVKLGTNSYELALNKAATIWLQSSK